MMMSLRSPFGGKPLRSWMRTEKKGKPNLDLADKAVPSVSEESFYCLKIGYYEDGSEVLIKDTEAAQLFYLLRKYYD